MADALSVIPAAVLRNLSDKLYEKRKIAVLEIGGIVKQLAMVGDHDKIATAINLLTTEFTYSSQANHRKATNLVPGGLIGLAAATVGLTTEAAQHFEVVRGDFISFFNHIFDALCKLFISFFNHIFHALCKLSGDSDPNVQSAAHLLDQLVKAYQHTSSVIQSLTEVDINVKLLVQLDKLTRLLETPLFTYLRLQLLEPGKYVWLLKPLYGFLMLLPQQSAAFKILRTRLRTIPSYTFSGDHLRGTASGNPYSQMLSHIPGRAHVIEDGEWTHEDAAGSNQHNGINFASRLHQFEQMQQRHWQHSRSKSQSQTSISSNMEVQRPEEIHRQTSVSDISRRLSRS